MKNGEFATPSAAYFPVSSEHSSYGFTILFDDKRNQYPKTVTTSVFDAAGVLLAASVTSVSSARHAVTLPTNITTRS